MLKYKLICNVFKLKDQPQELRTLELWNISLWPTFFIFKVLLCTKKATPGHVDGMEFAP